METASFILPKLAISVLLISTAVLPVFGEGQMVMEEVIMEESNAMNGEEKISNLPLKVMVVEETVAGRQSCPKIHGKCSASIPLECCPGLHCYIPPDSPIGAPGTCVLPCANAGKECNPSIGRACCPPLSCHVPPGSGPGTPGTCVVRF